MLLINIDTSQLSDLADIDSEIRKAAAEETRNLAQMAHAKAIELAGQRLHSRRDKFIQALSMHEDQGVYVLQLDAEARWIDDGFERRSMLDDLIASPKAKQAADGSKFLVVPFDHSPGHGPTNTPASTLDLVTAVKAEMKLKKIPWAKIERNDQGQPLLGRLHKFNVVTTPYEKTHEGPGQGHGKVGHIKQGPTGIPFLQGVGVYQKMGPDEKVKRSVMTFRIASSKHQGQERWVHPGIEPVRILDDVEAWCYKTAEEEILPRLIERLTSS